MMRLTTMWNVDATIDDEGSSPIAEQILAQWAYDRGSVRFFRSSANFIYRFRQQDEERFLRFAAASERSRELIDAEMELAQALAAAGVAVAPPLSSKSGSTVETVVTPWGAFHAVVFPALAGQQYECDEMDDSGFRRWGAALGNVHVAMSALASSPDAPARPTWRDHLAFIRPELPSDSPDLLTEFDDIAASLAALPASADTYGLIHGDFELDNLVWQSSAVAALDFDDCAYHWYVGDVVFALRDVLDSGAGMDDGRCRAFVEGYREQRPLSEDSLSSAPLFFRLTRLLHYARMARSVDLTTRSEHPEWLIELKAKLLQRMADYRAYIEAHP